MLRCSFYQNLYYTCTNSELHLFYIWLYFMLICTHYLHMYRLVLMTLIYTCFANSSCFPSCICIFNSNLINIHVYPWVSCLHANIINRLFYVWDMYVYVSFWINHTYTMKISVLMKNNFSCFFFALKMWLMIFLSLNVYAIYMIS